MCMNVFTCRQMCLFSTITSTRFSAVSAYFYLETYLSANAHFLPHCLLSLTSNLFQTIKNTCWRAADNIPSWRINWHVRISWIILYTDINKSFQSHDCILTHREKRDCGTPIPLWGLSRAAQNFAFTLIFAPITPRNGLKFMFTPSLLNHAGCQIDLSHNNTIFHPIPVFKLWNMTNNAIPLSPSGSPYWQFITSLFVD